MCPPHSVCRELQSVALVGDGAVFLLVDLVVPSGHMRPAQLGNLPSSTDVKLEARGGLGRPELSELTHTTTSIKDRKKETVGPAHIS